MDWSGFCSSRCQTSRKSLRHFKQRFSSPGIFGISFSYVSVWITADKKNFRVLFTVQDNLLVAANETPPLLLLTPLIGWVKIPLSPVRSRSSSRGSFQDGRGKCPSWTLSFFSFFVLAFIDSSFKTIMRTKSTDLNVHFSLFPSLEARDPRRKNVFFRQSKWETL